MRKIKQNCGQNKNEVGEKNNQKGEEKSLNRIQARVLNLTERLVFLATFGKKVNNSSGVLHFS
jgi:hypothetical protein